LEAFRLSDIVCKDGNGGGGVGNLQAVDGPERYGPGEHPMKDLCKRFIISLEIREKEWIRSEKIAIEGFSDGEGFFGGKGRSEGCLLRDPNIEGGGKFSDYRAKAG
jgi:hypothetical protein